MNSKCVLAYFFTLLIEYVSGHAVYFTNEQYCSSRSLAVGQTIMGANAKADTTGKTMIVKRNGASLASGNNYLSGETLQVTVSGFSNLNFEIVLQVQGGGATFQNGGVKCGGWSRAAASNVNGAKTYVGIDSATGTAALLMPAVGSGDVTVFAGLAFGSGTVTIVSSFILKDQSITTPISVPSSSPSVKPLSLTAKPFVALPTRKPSAVPSRPTLKPSANPTSKPSKKVSVSPSLKPAANASPTRKPSEDTPSSRKPSEDTPSSRKPSEDMPSSRKPSEDTPQSKPSAKPSSKPTALPISEPVNVWSSQGGNIKNSRNVEGSLVKASTLSLSNPTHQFLVGFSVSATPAIFGEYVIFPSLDGFLYAFNKTSKTMIWSKNIKEAYYPKSALTQVKCRNTPAKYGSSFLVGLLGPADVIKVDIATGSLLGKVTLSSHIAAIVTMSGTVYNGKLYVGVSSNEETFASDPSYTCCSFGGTFHAVDIATMRLVWTWWAIPFNLVGPSNFAGAAIWGSSPAIDTETGVVYFATGNNYVIPDELDNCYNVTVEADWEKNCNLLYGPDNYINSVVALSVDTGAKVWARRTNAYDAWTVGCLYDGAPNCPKSPGPDADFGMAPVLSTVSGQKALFIGQKNGITHRLNPVDGTTVWATQTCPGGTLGGISWGISVDDSQVYVSCINYLHLPWTLKNGTVIYGGGWAALDKAAGSVLWTTANPANFDPSGGVFNVSSNGRAFSSWGAGPSTSVGDIVLVGSSDSVYKPKLQGGSPKYGNGGFVYSLRKTTGAVLSSYETKAGVYGGFAVDKNCAFIGSGYSFLSSGKGVYGWCI